MTDEECAALCDALAIADVRYDQQRGARPEADSWAAVWAWGRLSARIDRMTLGEARRLLLQGVS